MVSIILLAHDRWADTRRCLLALKASTDPRRYEVLVCDNASRDATLAGLRRMARAWPQLRVLRHECNLPFAAAMNRAMAQARGRHFLWLNNDTEPSAGWLDGLLGAVESGPGVAAAGPMTDNMAPPQQLARPFRTTVPSGVEDAPFLGGFCLLLKRRAVEEIGRLDERFVWGWEDMDYCLRLRQAGGRLALARDVFVRHAGSRTIRELPSLERSRLDLRNRRLILEKWPPAEGRRSELAELLQKMPAPWQPLRPKISVLLVDGLGSWQRFGRDPAVEVLAAARAKRSAAELDRIRKTWPEFKVLGPWPEASFGEAVNRAAAAARGDHLVISDGQAAVRADWLQELLRAAQSRREAGLVRSDSCLLVPRQVFTRVGGFDGRLGGARCIHDYCLRAAQAGLSVMEAGSGRPVELRPGASIIVPVRGDPRDLRRSLDAVRAGSGKLSCEVLSAALGPEASFGEAVNRAAAGARGEQLVIMEEGAAVAPLRLKRLLATGRTYPSAGLVRSAAGLLVPRRSFERVGGFDERLAGALSLQDYCLRAAQAGLHAIEIDAPRAKPPRLETSIIVLGRGQWRALRRSLEAARAGCAKVSCEVISAALGPDAQTAAGLRAMAEAWPQLKVFGPWKTHSWAHAINLAARSAQGEQLVILQENAAPAPGWLQELRRAAHSLPEAGLVRSAAGLLVPRQVLERTGDFDARFVGALATADYCLRAAQEGFVVAQAGPAGCAPRPEPQDLRLARHKWVDPRWAPPGFLESLLGKAPHTHIRRPQVSLIVVNRGRWRALRRSLEAARAGCAKVSCEVISAALGPDAQTAAGLRAMAEAWPQLKVLGPWKTHSWAHAVNLAARSAQGEQLVILHEGAAPAPGWLRELRRAAPSRPEAGLVRSAAGLLVPRQVLERLGGFDERFLGALGAADYCLRAAQEGFVVAEAGPGGRASRPEPQDLKLARHKWLDPQWAPPGWQERLWKEALPPHGLRPEFSVIALGRGKWRDLRRGLESLRACSQKASCEVLTASLTQDAKTAAGLRAMADAWPQLRVLGPWPRTSFAQAVNRAAAAARGEQLVILQEGAAPGRLRRLLRAAPSQAGVVRSAAGLLVPRRVFSQVGALDDRFQDGLWAEDLCFRVSQRGLQVLRADRESGHGRSHPCAHDRKLIFEKWAGHPALGLQTRQGP